MRVTANLPDDDPGYDELRAYIEGMQGKGQGSPVRRAAGELMRLGYLVATGKIGGGAAPAEVGANLPVDPATAAAERAAIAEAAEEWGFG